MHLLPSRHASSHLLVFTLILISAPHEAVRRDQEPPRNKLMAATEEGRRLKNVSQGMGRLERVKLLSLVPGCLGTRMAQSLSGHRGSATVW